MQLIDPRNQVVSGWTVDQFLLVQKFMPTHLYTSRDVFGLDVGQVLELSLSELEIQLGRAHENIMCGLQSAVHFDQIAQLHRAGLLIALLQDRLARMQLSGDTPIRCLIADS